MAANLDFEATYEKVASVIPNVIRERAGRKPQLDVGAISFKLPSTNISVLIFPKGPPHKIQVMWTNIKEKETCFPKLKSLLVSLDSNKPVTLLKLHMNVFKVPFPVPSNFEWPWCAEKHHYQKVRGNPFLDKRERKLIDLDAEYFELLIKLHLGKEAVAGQLFGSPIILFHKAENVSH